MNVSSTRPVPAVAPTSPRPPWALAWRIAFGQIVAWGILYYAFTVIVGPMQASTGWSRNFLNAGLSVGLLMWGICALPVGLWIQRRGGRGVMTLASAIGGAALVLMGSVVDPVAYQIAWLLLGAAMAGLLYDSAFAVITAAFGPEYRRGIMLVTLVGGLASTVFIPLAQYAVARLGWSQALIALGVGQIAIGVPLHAWGVPTIVTETLTQPSTARRSRRKRISAWAREFARDLAEPRFLGLAIWFTAHAAAFTGLIFHLMPVLQAMGVPTSAQLLAIATFGPVQVLGRFVLMTRGGHFSTLRVGRWAIGGLFVAVSILLVLPPSLGPLLAFAALFGAGNGVTTILRGTAIAEVFGRDRYPELNGALSAPAVLAKAASPLVLASVWSATSHAKSVLVGVLVLVIAAGAGLWVTGRAQVRPR